MLCDQIGPRINFPLLKFGGPTPQSLSICTTSATPEFIPVCPALPAPLPEIGFLIFVFAVAFVFFFFLAPVFPDASSLPPDGPAMLRIHLAVEYEVGRGDSPLLVPAPSSAAHGLTGVT